MSSKLLISELLAHGLLAALATALLVAAATDLRHRRIGNRLNAAIAIGAPFYWWASGIGLWPGAVIQLGLAAGAFAILAGLFALRLLGGGDVKLLAALALWIAPIAYLRLLVVMSMAGGVLALLFWAWHIIRRKPERIAIPYGVAIAFAGLMSLAESAKLAPPS